MAEFCVEYIYNVETLLYVRMFFFGGSLHYGSIDVILRSTPDLEGTALGRGGKGSLGPSPSPLSHQIGAEYVTLVWFQ